VGAEFFHAEGKTEGQNDMTKLLVALRNFANASKNLLLFCSEFGQHAVGLLEGTTEFLMQLVSLSISLWSSLALLVDEYKR
jgi:hypothetical protein